MSGLPKYTDSQLQVINDLDQGAIRKDFGLYAREYPGAMTTASLQNGQNVMVGRTH